MDSPELTQRNKKSLQSRYVILRWSFAVLFSVLAFLSLSFMVGFVTVLVGDSSMSSPISVPSQCKIVSSSVDLRSSKVCELGLLNHKAKHVFYPFERRGFRCRYDYYWASVFKVEYKDLILGHTQLAFAEAPNEALPLDCRPNFGAAWLTKDKFKVNESYDCWYTSSFSKVNIYDDKFFSCQAKDPSMTEMMKRYVILLPSLLNTWFSRDERPKYRSWETVAGIIAGFSTSLISISLVKLLQHMKLLQHIKPSLLQISSQKLLSSLRACFLVAYLSFMGWLAIQYGKRLGFTV